MRATTDARLDTVQLLRALAALMVVSAHAMTFASVQAAALGLPAFSPPRLPLGAGVDLFFVISGFIIVFASERFFAAPGGGAEFMRRRVCRIVPLWWFALSLQVAVLSVSAAGGRAAMPGAEAVATSFAFIPYDAMGQGTRFPFPVLDLGWSLDYEMLFYVLFACAMFLPRDRACLAVVGALLAGVAAAALHPPAAVALWFWSRPLVLEFALGIGVALLFRRGMRLPTAARLSLAALGVALWWLVDLAWLGAEPGPFEYGWPRALVWGGGAAMVLAAAVLGHTEVRDGALRRLTRLGDSSYALYLLHPFVILAIRIACKSLPAAALAPWPLAATVVVAAVLVADRFHRAVERPAVGALQRAWRPGPRRTPGTAWRRLGAVGSGRASADAAPPP